MLTASQQYRYPEHPTTIPFSTALLALPTDIQIRIFLYLSPDDLSILARCVRDLSQLDQDPYLRRIWHSQTAPARLDFALFSPLHARPDPQELVRRGTLRGVAIVSGVRSRGYWASEAAVRLSTTHYNINQAQIRRHLSQALSSTRRPSPSALHARHILPSPSITTTSPWISAKAYTLEKARERDKIKRTLMASRIGRTLGEMVGENRAFGRLWESGSVEDERVRWAICPGIREKRRFYEELSKC